MAHLVDGLLVVVLLAQGLEVERVIHECSVSPMWLDVVYDFSQHHPSLFLTLHTERMFRDVLIP